MARATAAPYLVTTPMSWASQDLVGTGDRSRSAQFYAVGLDFRHDVVHASTETLFRASFYFVERYMTENTIQKIVTRLKKKKKIRNDIS